MECPRGSLVTETTHQVKKINTAREWYSEVNDKDLPISVTQYTALNGRCVIKIRDKENNIIHQRG